MNLIEKIACIFMFVCLIASVVGVIVEKIRTSKDWIGQGYGRK